MNDNDSIREVFKLELRVVIRKVTVDEDGIGLRWSDRLEVMDTKDLGAMDFAGVARVLTRFDEVAQSLVAEIGEQA